MKIFGREPVVILAFIAVLLKLFSAYVIDVSPTQQGVIMAVLSAIVAVVTAIMLKNGALYAAFINLAQGVQALVMAFGLHLSAEEQALWMSLVETALALFAVRPQVTAPVTVHPIETHSPGDKYELAA